jgi:glycosyltransferase involved in cell wall biosynthesis
MVPVRLIWVANFKRSKNPEIFVELAERFSGNDAVEFVMVGRPGDRSIYEALHERIARADNLTYLGELSIDEVNEEIARSDLFVNTSTAEGFPNTFIQAWLRSVPVLSCWVDPDGCLSEHGGGILAGAPERLAPIVGELLSDPNRLRELGATAKDHAHAHHHPKEAEKLIDVFLRVGGAQRKSGEGTEE